MSITRYCIYGTFGDLIKLYRRALKAGYSYGEIEPLSADDEHVKMDLARSGQSRYSTAKKKVITVDDLPSRYTRGKFSQTLLYRNYAQVTVNKPDFELFKLMIVKE